MIILTIFIGLIPSITNMFSPQILQPQHKVAFNYRIQKEVTDHIKTLKNN